MPSHIMRQDFQPDELVQELSLEAVRTYPGEITSEGDQAGQIRLAEEELGIKPLQPLIPEEISERVTAVLREAGLPSEIVENARRDVIRHVRSMNSADKISEIRLSMREKLSLPADAVDSEVEKAINVDARISWLLYDTPSLTEWLNRDVEEHLRAGRSVSPPHTRELLAEAVPFDEGSKKIEHLLARLGAGLADFRNLHAFFHPEEEAKILAEGSFLQRGLEYAQAGYSVSINIKPFYSGGSKFSLNITASIPEQGIGNATIMGVDFNNLQGKSPNEIGEILISEHRKITASQNSDSLKGKESRGRFSFLRSFGMWLSELPYRIGESFSSFPEGDTAPPRD